MNIVKATDVDSTLLVTLTIGQLRDLVRTEIQAAMAIIDLPSLLTPEGLAEKLNVPVSWVYEQSRQGNIPTKRIGRYIRFDFREVVESQKKNRSVA